ncbi:hypothetical protein CVT26_001591 [Gymnopilus dilepis]|uniref:Uncharacterized protein n=1 Tax=Gymnopilus dilepis TaxID=231916 RepID=A0A409VTN8_9AGAR|nr:hypothetical protein CVT26_001591 [Gymnopilus dilepis]
MAIKVHRASQSPSFEQLGSHGTTIMKKKRRSKKDFDVHFAKRLPSLLESYTACRMRALLGVYLNHLYPHPAESARPSRTAGQHVQRVFFIFRDDGNSVRSTPIIQEKMWDTLARPAAAAAPVLGYYNRGNRSTADKNDLLGNRRDKLSLGSSSNEKAKDYRVKVKRRLAG